LNLLRISSAKSRLLAGPNHTADELAREVGRGFIPGKSPTESTWL
jgi:hypothetical protein